MKNKKTFIIFSSALIVIFLDQLTKFIVKNSLKINESIPVIKNIVYITYITNTGSGFGILKGWQLPVIFFSFIVIGIIFYYIDKIKEKETSLQVFAGFILGATIGNLIDRLLFSHVIDFFDFRIWPVFNLADSFMTVSVIFLVFYFWKK
jgi:signal peptidase II